MNDSDHELLSRVLDENRALRTAVVQVHGVIARVDDHAKRTSDDVREIKEFLLRMRDDHSDRIDDTARRIVLMEAHKLPERVDELSAMRWQVKGAFALISLLGLSGLAAVARALILGGP